MVLILVVKALVEEEENEELGLMAKEAAKASGLKTIYSSYPKSELVQILLERNVITWNHQYQNSKNRVETKHFLPNLQSRTN